MDRVVAEHVQHAFVAAAPHAHAAAQKTIGILLATWMALTAVCQFNPMSIICFSPVNGTISAFSELVHNYACGNSPNSNSVDDFSMVNAPLPDLDPTPVVDWVIPHTTPNDLEGLQSAYFLMSAAKASTVARPPAATATVVLSAPVRPVRAVSKDVQLALNIGQAVGKASDIVVDSVHGLQDAVRYKMLKLYHDTMQIVHVVQSIPKAAQKLHHTAQDNMKHRYRTTKDAVRDMMRAFSDTAQGLLCAMWLDRKTMWWRRDNTKQLSNSLQPVRQLRPSFFSSLLSAIRIWFNKALPALWSALKSFVLYVVLPFDFVVTFYCVLLPWLHALNPELFEKALNTLFGHRDVNNQNDVDGQPHAAGGDDNPDDDDNNGNDNGNPDDGHDGRGGGVQRPKPVENVNKPDENVTKPDGVNVAVTRVDPHTEPNPVPDDVKVEPAQHKVIHERKQDIPHVEQLETPATQPSDTAVAHDAAIDPVHEKTTIRKFALDVRRKILVDRFQKTAPKLQTAFKPTRKSRTSRDTPAGNVAERVAEAPVAVSITDDTNSVAPTTSEDVGLGPTTHNSTALKSIEEAAEQPVTDQPPADTVNDAAERPIPDQIPANTVNEAPASKAIASVPTISKPTTLDTTAEAAETSVAEQVSANTVDEASITSEPIAPEPKILKSTTSDATAEATTQPINDEPPANAGREAPTTAEPPKDVVAAPVADNTSISESHEPQTIQQPVVNASTEVPRPPATTPESKAATAKRTSTQARHIFLQTFPGGRYEKLLTSGVNLECAIHALVLSIAAQAPSVGQATAEQLRAILKTKEWQEKVEFLETWEPLELHLRENHRNTNNFRNDQAAYMLRLWGLQRGVDLVLGVYQEGLWYTDTTIIDSDPSPRPRHYIWIHNDDAEARHKRDNPFSKENVLNHWSGMKRPNHSLQSPLDKVPIISSGCVFDDHDPAPEVSSDREATQTPATNRAAAAPNNTAADEPLVTQPFDHEVRGQDFMADDVTEEADADAFDDSPPGPSSPSQHLDAREPADSAVVNPPVAATNAGTTDEQLVTQLVDHKAHNQDLIVDNKADEADADALDNLPPLPLSPSSPPQDSDARDDTGSAVANSPVTAADAANAGEPQVTDSAASTEDADKSIVEEAEEGKKKKKTRRGKRGPGAKKTAKMAAKKAAQQAAEQAAEAPAPDGTAANVPSQSTEQPPTEQTEVAAHAAAEAPATDNTAANVTSEITERPATEQTGEAADDAAGSSVADDTAADVPSKTVKHPATNQTAAKNKKNKRRPLRPGQKEQKAFEAALPFANIVQTPREATDDTIVSTPHAVADDVTAVEVQVTEPVKQETAAPAPANTVQGEDVDTAFYNKFFADLAAATAEDVQVTGTATHETPSAEPFNVIRGAASDNTVINTSLGAADAAIAGEVQVIEPTSDETAAIDPLAALQELQAVTLEVFSRAFPHWFDVLPVPQVDLLMRIPIAIARSINMQLRPLGVQGPTAVELLAVRNAPQFVSDMRALGFSQDQIDSFVNLDQAFEALRRWGQQRGYNFQQGTYNTRLGPLLGPVWNSFPTLVVWVHYDAATDVVSAMGPVREAIQTPVINQTVPAANTTPAAQQPVTAPQDHTLTNQGSIDNRMADEGNADMALETETSDHELADEDSHLAPGDYRREATKEINEDTVVDMGPSSLFARAKKPDNREAVTPAAAAVESPPTMIEHQPPVSSGNNAESSATPAPFTFGAGINSSRHASAAVETPSTTTGPQPTASFDFASTQNNAVTFSPGLNSSRHAPAAADFITSFAAALSAFETTGTVAQPSAPLTHDFGFPVQSSAASQPFTFSTGLNSSRHATTAVGTASTATAPQPPINFNFGNTDNSAVTFGAGFNSSKYASTASGTVNYLPGGPSAAFLAQPDEVDLGPGPKESGEQMVTDGPPTGDAMDEGLDEDDLDVMKMLEEEFDRKDRDETIVDAPPAGDPEETQIDDEDRDMLKDIAPDNDDGDVDGDGEDDLDRIYDDDEAEEEDKDPNDDSSDVDDDDDIYALSDGGSEDRTYWEVMGLAPGDYQREATNEVNEHTEVDMGPSSLFGRIKLPSQSEEPQTDQPQTDQSQPLLPGLGDPPTELPPLELFTVEDYGDNKASNEASNEVHDDDDVNIVGTDNGPHWNLDPALRNIKPLRKRAGGLMSSKYATAATPTVDPSAAAPSAGSSAPLGRNPNIPTFGTSSPLRQNGHPPFVPARPSKLAGIMKEVTGKSTYHGDAPRK